MDIMKLCEENSTNMYMHQDAILAIMESLASPSREWLIPVQIEHSKSLGK
jgi:hypothetical protein